MNAKIMNCLVYSRSGFFSTYYISLFGTIVIVWLMYLS